MKGGVNIGKLDMVCAVWASAGYCFAARITVQPRSVFGEAGLTAMMCAAATIAILLT